MEWTDYRREHFDAKLLPAKHRKTAGDGLFSVVDVLPARAPEPPRTEPRDGQLDLFTETSE